MNQFKLNRKMKLVIASILVLLVLVGCQNVIDPDTGRVATEHIIGLDTMELLSGILHRHTNLPNGSNHQLLIRIRWCNPSNYYLNTRHSGLNLSLNR